jgi:hypothetical protein
MDGARFWKIVGGSPVDPCCQAELLTDALADLTAGDVLGFRRQFIAAHRRPYTRRMWLAAALLHSHPRGDVDLSGDSFTDFRSAPLQLPTHFELDPVGDRGRPTRLSLP